LFDTFHLISFLLKKNSTKILDSSANHLMVKSCEHHFNRVSIVFYSQKMWVW
jgi:hypothetical protein